MTGQREPAPWQRRLPNQLTCLRLALAAVFFVVLSQYRHGAWSWRGEPALPLIAAGVFLLAAITDALDGALARRWHAESVFGRVMDPFADKALILGAFVMLAGPGFVVSGAGGGAAEPSMVGTSVSGVAPWMVVVILSRELLVTSLRGLVESRGQSFAATAAGKWKMILQCVAVPLILLFVSWQAIGAPEGRGGTVEPKTGAATGPVFWCQLAAWVTTVVTAWSAIPYVTRAVRVLRPTEAGSP